jgi:hypothetical protein
LSTNIWSEDTDDWEIQPLGTQPKSKIDANYASIIGLDYQQHGNIVLTHEINAGTMEEFIEQYPNIKGKFKNIVPITACMNISNPYPENITYPTFAEYVAGDIMPLGLPSGTTIKPTAAKYIPQAYAKQTTLSNILPMTGSSAASSPSSTGSSNSTKAGDASSSSSNLYIPQWAWFCSLAISASLFAFM